MQYKILGNTGLWVSKLCFGAMGFGGTEFWSNVGQIQQHEANDQVAKALDAGMNFFDTANVYSYGLSEEILGKALGYKRSEVVLATKVRGRMAAGPNNAGLSRHHIIQQAEASLKRMNTDYIDLYQIHGIDPFTPFEETLRALEDLVRSGKVRHIGASNMMAWQLMKSLSLSDLKGYERFQCLQAYYAIAGRGLERELAPLLQDQKMGLMVWSPLAGGFLSGKYRRNDHPEPGSARRTTFDFPPVDKEKAYDIVDVMDEIAQNHHSSVAQIALAWLLHKEVVTSVIIGVKRMEQLEDNLNAMEIELSDEEMNRLDEISEIPQEYPGWMVNFMQGDRDPNQSQTSESTEE